MSITDVPNAIKFTKEGTVEVIVEEQVGKVTVSVKDSGTGIDANTIPSIIFKICYKIISRNRTRLVYLQRYNRSSRWTDMG